MASVISPLLRLELMATGEKSSTWGLTTNSNLKNVLESAIAGISTFAVPHTLTVANNAPDEARSAILVATGAIGSAQKITIPAVSKVYVVRNATTGGFAVTIGTAAGDLAIVPYQSTMTVYCDGANTYPTIDMGLVEAAAASLALKAPLASPTFTGTATFSGTVAGITKTTVGLANVDNTTDALKPVSTAQGAAIGLKANLASPTFTGTPKSTTPAQFDGTTNIATMEAVQEALGSLRPDVASYSATKTLTAADVGKSITLGGTAAWTLTLPSGVNAPSGSAVHLYKTGGAGTVTVRCGGTDTIITSSGATPTSIALENGADVMLVKHGGLWIIRGGSVRLRYAPDFDSTFASAAGSMSFPNGFTMQWGVHRFTHASAGTLNALITLEHPQSMFFYCDANVETSTPNAYHASAIMHSATQLRVYSYNAGYGDVDVKYCAFGIKS